MSHPQTNSLRYMFRSIRWGVLYSYGVARLHSSFLITGPDSYPVRTIGQTGKSVLPGRIHHRWRAAAFPGLLPVLIPII